jgi:DNA-binding NarL/FixJ family response regulator/class 3 adenylate cyclase
MREPSGDDLRMVEEGFVTILFTDLVGSTSLFAEQGDDAADSMRREHFVSLRRAIAEHDGREVKSTGDGLMVAFSSAASALRCAVAMQRGAEEAASGLELRVGIDAGEPLPEGDDLYGTPVIVASRLCDAAGAGEILATEVVCRIASPRVNVRIEPAGAIEARGIKDPIQAARVHWRAGSGPLPRDTAQPMPEIRVLIADDQNLVRAGFRAILEGQPGISVVGEAVDGRDAVDLARRRRPDVVLMDIQMPDLDGLEATRRIHAEAAEHPVAVLMLTTFDLNEYVYEALRAGASGFLLKDVLPEDLIAAVRVVAAGDGLIAPTITKRLIEQFARTAPPSAPPRGLEDLTAREVEVLTLVARGLSNGEIAQELVLSEATVKTHVKRVLSKLDARDRVQAVVLAYEAGLVTPGDAAQGP